MHLPEMVQQAAMDGQGERFAARIATLTAAKL